MIERDTYRAHVTRRCGCRMLPEGRNGRPIRACHVPGTPEAGRVASLRNAPTVRQIRRDPFAHATLIRFAYPVSWAQSDCRWCGRKTSVRYAWVPDARGAKFWTDVAACSVGCFDIIAERQFS